MFDKINKIHKEYSKKSYNDKLNSGKLLTESAMLLLKINCKTIPKDSILERNYLMEKIALELLQQAANMSNTERHRSSTLIKKYTYLAFELAFEFCDFKPNRKLIPFLIDIINYEKYNHNNKYLEELNELYEESILLKNKFMDELMASG